PRNFVMVLDHTVQRKVEALGLTDQDIFRDFNLWKKEFVINNAGNDITLKAEKEQLAQVFGQIRVKAQQSDPTLDYAAEAAKTRALKIMGHFAVKLRKAEERKASSAIKKMQDLKSILFPGGSPQERRENFLQFFLEDPEFIEKL